MMKRSLATSISLCLLVLVACAPTPPVTGSGAVPGAVAPPAGRPSVPGGDAASPLTSVAAQVVFPAGTWLKLRSPFGVKGVVNPEDISADDLASLKIEVNGLLLTLEQFSFGDLHWGPNGELVATLNLNNLPPSEQVTIGISNQSGSVALLAIATSASSANIQIDVNSTARALIVQNMAEKGIIVTPEEVSERAVQLVANQLTQVMTSQFGRPIFGSTGVSSVLQVVGHALVLQDPAQLSAELAAAEKTYGTQPSGSGGTFTAGGGSTSGGGGTTSGSGSPATGLYVATGAPFGEPQFHRMAMIGSRLWSSMNGARLRYSDDFGAHWTEFAGDFRYGIELAVDGTDLYGFPIQVQDQWQKIWRLDTTTNTVTNIDTTGLPTFVNPRGALYYGSNLYFGDTTTQKVYYKNLASGLWYQFGTGSLGSYPYDLETDGTHLFASSQNGVYQLDLATPGGNWTLLTGGATPASGGDLLYEGSTLYTLYGDQLMAWDGANWTQETVSAGLSGQRLWTDGTTLIVAGNQTQAYTGNGVYEAKYVGYAFQRPLAGGAWSQLGDPFRGISYFATDIFQSGGGDTLIGYQRLSNGGSAWDSLYLESASYNLGALVSAGGYVWALHDSQVWRLPAAGGAWQQVETGLPGGWVTSIDDSQKLVGLGNQLFLAVGREVYTLDASQGAPTWSLFGGGLVPDAVNRMATDGTDLFALDSTGQVHQVPLSGGAWSAYGPSAGLNATLLAAASGKVYAYKSTDQKLYTLENSGGTWSASPALTGFWVDEMVASNVRVMVAGSPSDGQSGIRQWDGTSWAPMSGAPVNFGQSLATGTDGYFGYFPAFGLFKLPFGSTTWQLIDGYKYPAQRMTLEPTTGKLYMMTTGAGIQQTL